VQGFLLSVTFAFRSSIFYSLLQLNHLQRHRFSILLTAASLVLLAVFLLVFLRNSYHQEIASLQKETGYLFVNSIQGIEGEMLDKIMFENVGAIPDSLRKRLIDKRMDFKSDSLHTFSYVSEDVSEIVGDSAVEVTIATHGKPGKISDLQGSISIFLAMDGTEEMHDTLFGEEELAKVLERMETDFSATMKKANLPVKYKVVKLKSDTLGRSDLMGNATYTDLASGEKYGVELSGFNTYVLKKILPEILFSIGLFACVSLAFFVVLKNLRAQQRLTELKNDFIRNVTHELKTPIATVGVAIEALQDFGAIKDPQKTKEYLDISKNELSRLSILVDKVLRMSLFEKSAPELKLERVQLVGLVSEILDSMKLQFEKKKAEVHFSESRDSLAIIGDRVHLASVVYNLLDNALKYGDSHTKITVAISESDGQVELKISDNGKGIPQEYQDRVFEKFFRVPKGDTHNVKGHGLGLSYVASVVQKHNGTISMQSKVGEGTTFTIRFGSMAS